MDYSFMDNLENGIIIEKFTGFETVYINKSAKNLLCLPENVESIRGNISDNNSSIEEVRSKIVEDLGKDEISINKICLKSHDDVFLEVSFECRWLDKENDLICLVFDAPIEVLADKNIKFHEVAESLPSGVIVMDVEDEMTLTYANSEQYKIMGIDESKKELNTMLKDTIYEEDKDWVMQEVYRNLHMGRDVDIEFRMKATGDVVKWVRLYGRAKKSSTGSNLFYSSLKDLSNRREINDKLHLERVLFHKMTEMSDEIIFRADLKTEIIHFLGTKFTKVFGFEDTVVEDFAGGILRSDIVIEEDLPIFEMMLQSFIKGEVKLIQLRLRLPDVSVEWHEIQYNFVKSSQNEPLLVIGKIVNIHKQKLLEEQARIDLLTGFYNKINTAMTINKLILETSESGDDASFALFIIDIDNFKAINDNLGHHFGDIVLHDIAGDIRDCFRKNDILGRIGGDEFIAVMRNCEDKEVIQAKAQQICSSLEKTFMGQTQNYTISASIGIARYPFDGTSYEALYKKSDLALYKTKERGKNGYTIFSNDLNSKNKQLMSTIHKAQRTSGALVDVTVIATVFNLLYETKDIRLSLNTVLEYIGITYKVDRCYIFQTLDHGSVFTNEYQWDRGIGFIAEERVQYLEHDMLMSIFRLANEDGIYWTNNIYDVQNKETIKVLEHDKVISIFLVDSLKKDERKAFFGIEDCKNKRTWTMQEERTLFHVARIIFGSLTGYNIIQGLSKRVKELEKKLVKRENGQNLSNL